MAGARDAAAGTIRSAAGAAARCPGRCPTHLPRRCPCPDRCRRRHPCPDRGCRFDRRRRRRGVQRDARRDRADQQRPARTGATIGGSGSRVTGGGSTRRTTRGGSIRGGGRRTGIGLRSVSTPLRSAGGGGAGSLMTSAATAAAGSGRDQKHHVHRRAIDGRHRGGVGSRPSVARDEPGEQRRVQRAGERDRQSRLAADAGQRAKERAIRRRGVAGRANGPRRSRRLR